MYMNIDCCPRQFTCMLANVPPPPSLSLTSCLPPSSTCQLAPAVEEPPARLGSLFVCRYVFVTGGHITACILPCLLLRKKCNCTYSQDGSTLYCKYLSFLHPSPMPTFQTLYQVILIFLCQQNRPHWKLCNSHSADPCYWECTLCRSSFHLKCAVTNSTRKHLAKSSLGI